MSSAATATTAPNSRERIVAAACELFWLQGYQSTSLSEITAKAKVNPGSLYYFFKTKESVLLAVLDWYLANLDREVIHPAFERASDPIERIFAILDGYRFGLTYTECTGGCPIGNLSIEVGDHLPAAREKIKQNFENWRLRIADCLRAAADAGQLPRGTDFDQLSNFVLVVMEGAIMQARAHGNVAPFDASVAELRGYFNLLMNRRSAATRDAAALEQ